MDYYKVMGLRRDATAEEIKKAFRNLALKFHPDRHSQSSKRQQDAASRRFREASEAYQVLSNAKKRAIYNREGRAGLQYEQEQAAREAQGGASRSNYGRRYGSDYGYRGGGHGFHYSYQWGGGAGRYHWSWTFRPRSFTTVDFVFHALFVGLVTYGFFFSGSLGRYIWDTKNTGKSFKDVMEARERAKEEKTLAGQGESVPWDQELHKEELDSDGSRK